jgi:hypothetical protein
MEADETRQLLIRLFSELKTDLNNLKTDMNDVKMDINTVYDGQEELKGQLKGNISAMETNINDVKTDVKMDTRAVAIGQVDLKTELKNDISAVKGDISALETNINAGQVELRREISDFQERIRNIEAGQAEFEERVTRNLCEDLSRNIEAGQAEFEERVTRNLREDLSRIIEAGQVELEERVTCAVDARLKNASSVVEAIRQDFETQLAALKLEAAKAAAWPTARMREVTRVPTARPPTPPERRRSERPDCWWCGRPGHLQKYCSQNRQKRWPWTRERGGGYLSRQSHPLASQLRC